MTIVNDLTGAGRASRPVSIKVWDPFVRLFHWSLLAFFAITWITADEWDRIHEIAGYAIAVLIGLRLVWGFIGPRYALFSNFVYGPSAVIAYVKDSVRLRAKRHLGHNPAGGAMIIALLLSLSVATGTGVMLIMDAFWEVEWVKDLHEGAANLTLGLVFLHLVGVFISSLLHRENLVRSMITASNPAPDSFAAT